jgi:uroporphyrinogen-III synthase
MKVIVTRPSLQACEWVQKMCDQGLQAVALPLIQVQPLLDVQPLILHWKDLPLKKLVVFVSPNAVVCFFAVKPASQDWPTKTMAASAGPGTTAELRRHGVPLSNIIEPAVGATQFDSEALWQQLALKDWHATQVLLVRGANGREWLAERLRLSGAQVCAVAAYQRTLPTLSEAEQQQLVDALQFPQTYLWFFSSSEAIDHLDTLCPAARWDDAGAVVSHSRIAGRARALGIGKVRHTKPAFSDVMACIQSWPS